MPEKVMPGPVEGTGGIREAVCVHTRKIYDSCRDKDCIEDLTFYPTATAQSVIDASQSIRGGRVELLHIGVDVEPVSFNRGFFTVDMRFYYRVILQAVMIAGVLLAIHYIVGDHLLLDLAVISYMSSPATFSMQTFLKSEDGSAYVSTTNSLYCLVSILVYVVMAVVVY